MTSRDSDRRFHGMGRGSGVAMGHGSEKGRFFGTFLFYYLDFLPHATKFEIKLDRLALWDRIRARLVETAGKRAWRWSLTH